jgi:SAM-dependent methyltransferase
LTPPRPGEPADDSITGVVRDFYSRFPYPPLADEDTVEVMLGAELGYIRHILWPWREDLEGLTMLDAGCGTGQTSVSAALANTEIEITAIDVSPGALQQGRDLAAAAGVGDRVEFVEMTLESVGELGKKFDFISCTGVLHHLERREAGLRALAGALAEHGGMMLMLYAQYGRAPVYMIQELVRVLSAEAGLDQQMETVRAVLEELGEEHPFQAEDWGDAQNPGEAALADLLLNPRDRAYTVPEVYEFVEGAGLDLIRFHDDTTYDPGNYVQEGPLRDAVQALPVREGAQVAELLNGRLRTHTVFVGGPGNARRRRDTDSVDHLDRWPLLSLRYNWGMVQEVRGAAGLTFELTEAEGFYFRRGISLEQQQVDLLRRCDGTHTVRELAADPEVVAMLSGTTEAERLDTFGQLFADLEERGAVVMAPVQIAPR